MSLHSDGYNGCLMPFREISARFKIIEEDTVPLFVYCKESEPLINTLINEEYIDKNTLRHLSQFSLNIYKNRLKDLISSGDVRTVKENIYILENRELYNSKTGIETEEKEKFLIF